MYGRFLIFIPAASAAFWPTLLVRELSAVYWSWRLEKRTEAAICANKFDAAFDGIWFRFDEDVCQCCFKPNSIPADCNTSLIYTSIDANNALGGKSHCVFTDADNRSKQEFDGNICMNVAQFVCVWSTYYVFLCLGDVLQRSDPGQCRQTGERTGRK